MQIALLIFTNGSAMWVSAGSVANLPETAMEWNRSCYRSLMLIMVICQHNLSQQLEKSEQIANASNNALTHVQAQHAILQTQLSQQNLDHHTLMEELQAQRRRNAELEQSFADQSVFAQRAQAKEQELSQKILQAQREHELTTSNNQLALARLQAELNESKLSLEKAQTSVNQINSEFDDKYSLIHISKNVDF